MAVLTIDLPRSLSSFGDVVFFRPSTAQRHASPITVAAVLGEDSSMGRAYWIDSAGGSVLTQVRGVKLLLVLGSDSIPIPDRNGDGLPELLCRRPDRTIVVLGSDGKILENCKLPPGAVEARVLAAVPENSARIGVYAATDTHLLRMNVEANACTVVWSLPLPVDSNSQPSLRELRVLTDASSETPVALVCMMDAGASDSPAPESVICIPLDAHARPSEDWNLVAQSTNGSWFLGDPVFMSSNDASVALLADAKGVHWVDRHGRAHRIVAAPDGCEFSSAPLHLPGVVAGEMLAIGAIESSGPRVPLPVAHYQLWRIDEPRWLASLPVMSWIPSHRSITSVPDLDQDGRAEILIARVEVAGREFVDGLWEGMVESLNGSPTQLFALPAAVFDAQRINIALARYTR
jgi:hypothetical protein